MTRWALCGLALIIFALWMLIRPNRGIAHDGMIYALYALARLYPESIGHDFFVRYGTQDHFTVFSPLYALAIRTLGLDHTAALLIFITQVAFFCAAGWLVRRFTTADRALVGVGLLIFLPSWYGAGRVFSHTEMFLTPRQPAEVFVLLGIGFILDGRRLAAAACLLVSLLLHPIIAGAGVVFWILWEFALPRPKQALAVFLGGIALCALVALLPHTPLRRFDPEWLGVLQGRLSYLFPTLWPLRDWCAPIPGVATLLVGALRAENHQVRKLCITTLGTVAAGLALVLIGSDIMHVVVAAQLQTWRWLWLSGVLSSVLLPVIAIDSWKTGGLGRAAVLLLAAAWLASGAGLILVTTSLAWLCAWDAGHVRTARQQKAALAGACCFLAAAMFYVGNDVLTLLQQLPDVKAGSSHLASRIAQLRILAFNAPLCTAVMLVVWYLGLGATPRSSILLAFLGLALCLTALPYSISTWTRQEYPATDAAKFAAWRNIIPASAEVLWPDSPPTEVWYSLHRASYWSTLQMAGAVFSRQDLEFGMHREQAVEYRLPLLGGVVTGFVAVNPEHVSPQSTLTTLCGIPDLHYLVSWRDLGATPYPTVSMIQPATGKLAPMHLYYCNHDKS